MRSFELEGVKPRKYGRYWPVQIKGVGKLRLRDHWGVLAGSNVDKQVRILRYPLDIGYDVQLVAQHAVVPVVEASRAAVGIDVSVKANASLSNGAQYDRIVISERQAERCQRKVLRAKRGSRKRRKERHARAPAQLRQRNAVHAVTTDIVKHHSAYVIMEDLTLKGLTAKGGARKRGLNRAILSQSPGYFKQQLAYKAENAGGELVKVRPHYTAQQCSSYDGMSGDTIALDVRTYRREHCELVLNRDVNAATNIRLRGLDLFNRAGDPRHRADAEMPQQAVPLALKRCSTAKRGNDAGSYW